jgi:hypothetical protein
MKNQKQHFESMANNYLNDNISDFRTDLKKLNRSDLLRFVLHCELYWNDLLNIYEIEKLFNS